MIRELKLEDYDNVKTLVYQVHEIHMSNRPDIYLDGEPCPLGYFERILDKNNNVKYAYVEDDEIIGVIIGTNEITNNIPILKSRNVYHIDDIVVDKNHRN